MYREQPKKEKASQYLALTTILSLFAGIIAGVGLCAASTPKYLWTTIIIAPIFTLTILRLMFLIVEIDLFNTRNFDQDDFVDVSSEYNSGMKIVIKKFLDKLKF